VVPIGIDGAHRAFGRGAWFVKPTKLVVRYGAAWSAEQVLAPGGVEALRRAIAALAKVPLRECPPKSVPAPARAHTEPTSSADSGA
jgi:hypothetical protein